jgi:hypothetical protein
MSVANPANNTPEKARQSPTEHALSARMKQSVEDVAQRNED